MFCCEPLQILDSTLYVLSELSGFEEVTKRKNDTERGVCLCVLTHANNASKAVLVPFAPADNYK